MEPQREHLRFEIETRPNRGPEGGEQSDEQRAHTGREQYQPPAQVCDGDKRFRISGRDSRARFAREAKTIAA